MDLDKKIIVLDKLILLLHKIYFLVSIIIIKNILENRVKTPCF